VAFFQFGSLNMFNATHEMGHGYGIDHAWDTAQNKWCGNLPLGQYCDYWDTMGAPANGGTTFPNTNFGVQGASGPGLNAPHLDMLGWIDASRKFIYTPGTPAAEVTLAPLETPLDPGRLMAMVQIGGNPKHYYTVEYRRQRAWDAGVQDQVVMIHEVGGVGAPNANPGSTFLVDSLPNSTATVGPLWTAGQRFVDVANNIRISVVSTGETVTVDLSEANGTPPVLPCPAPGQSPAYASFEGEVFAACAVDTQADIQRQQPNGTWAPGNHIIPPRCSGCSPDPLSDLPPATLISAYYRVCGPASSANQYGIPCTTPTLVQINRTTSGGGGGSSGGGTGGSPPPGQKCCPKEQ
jgi:hypothetical protein